MASPSSPITVKNPRFFVSSPNNIFKTQAQTLILTTKFKTSSIICSSSCTSTSSSTTQENLPKKQTHVLDEKRDEKEEEEEEEEEEVGLRDIWREVQGCNNWEGLLDPMNNHLRREIIRYGEFAQGCYDSFDFDPHSKYCGSCKYHPSDFFSNLDLHLHKGYTITCYLYATSNINLPNFFQKSKLSSIWSQHANWMGYVAVATDEEEVSRLGRRDIVIAWRGTVTYLEWIYDLKDILCSANFGDDPLIKIELGFYDLYTKKEVSCKFSSFSAREQVLAEVKRLLEYYGTGEEGHEISITVTGHSLGASLALVSAYDIAELNLNYLPENNNKVPITVFSFSGPRVGNLRFKERCDELGLKVLRVVNIHDKVPSVPGIFANEKFHFQKYVEEKTSFPWSYAHVGVELALDHKKSPFLKQTRDLGCAHNLEALLHLVDGYHGKEEAETMFCSATNRDIALVNKSCDFLRSEYHVPPCWRQDENKGMVKSSDGRWVLPERPQLEPHWPEDIAHHLQQVLGNVNDYDFKPTVT
ncbi:PREDICTED: phospholipase A1-Igamma3, chloroplastic-like [Camelina sativa]|uniref:Phospholipase A1-Igamma3, chloroplastic-like n=1 Tax=Camelina sativa TaxID=90675 RepID=A0ABM0YGY4_CAMSA|nr:PREDICTED: phospholipase A1-Igamma3, chloroplastic-like [Camelina sativa]